MPFKERDLAVSRASTPVPHGLVLCFLKGLVTFGFYFSAPIGMKNRNFMNSYFCARLRRAFSSPTGIGDEKSSGLVIPFSLVFSSPTRDEKKTLFPSPVGTEKH